MKNITYRPQAGSGRYDVLINGTIRGFVVKQDDGLWQPWILRPAPEANVRASVPYTTRREAGEEVSIQWQGWNY